MKRPIRAITGDDVTITANHPMAGQTLNFHGVVSVGDATWDVRAAARMGGPAGRRPARREMRAWQRAPPRR